MRRGEGALRGECHARVTTVSGRLAGEHEPRTGCKAHQSDMARNGGKRVSSHRLRAKYGPREGGSHGLCQILRGEGSYGQLGTARGREAYAGGQSVTAKGRGLTQVVRRGSQVLPMDRASHRL